MIQNKYDLYVDVFSKTCKQNMFMSQTSRDVKLGKDQKVLDIRQGPLKENIPNLVYISLCRYQADSLERDVESLFGMLD